MEKIKIISIIISFSYLILVFALILKRKLREEFAIFWLLFSLLLIIFSIWNEGFVLIADILGIYDAPNIIFTSAIGLICFYLLHLSVASSKITNDNKKLAQKIADLEKEIREKSYDKNSSE